jgi:hypothetical protein
VLALDPRVFALIRTSPDGSERALCLHNVSGQGVTVRPDGEAAELMPGPVELGPYGVSWSLARVRSGAHAL